jgi:hypothetical protein
MINIACVGKSSAIRAISDAYRAHWKLQPLQDMPLLGMGRIVVIAGSDVEARALAAPAYARWFRTFSFLSRTRSLPVPPNLPTSFEQALDDGFCLVGSPSTVRETLKSQVVEAGVTYVMCQAHRIAREIVSVGILWKRFDQGQSPQAAYSSHGRGTPCVSWRASLITTSNDADMPLTRQRIQRVEVIDGQRDVIDG